MENIVISAKQMTRVAGLQKNFVIITTVLGFFFSTAKIVTHSQKKTPCGRCRCFSTLSGLSGQDS